MKERCPMNAEIKDRWVARLRDPNIKQGKGHLCTKMPSTGEVSYCCLGVLTELAVEEGVIPPGEWDREVIRGLLGKVYLDGEDDSYEDDLHQDAILPTRVREWAGLRDSNPFVNAPSPARRTTLATLNDRGATFAEIADIIEEQL
jgi:hypothetical protein